MIEGLVGYNSVQINIHVYKFCCIYSVYGLARLFPCMQKELTVGPMGDRMYCSIFGVQFVKNI